MISFPFVNLSSFRQRGKSLIESGCTGVNLPLIQFGIFTLYPSQERLPHGVRNMYAMTNLRIY